MTDLVVVHGGWSRITVYQQLSNGQYSVSSLEYPYASHVFERGMDIGDVNDDGRPDIVVIDWYWGIITLLNETPIVSVGSVEGVPTEFKLFQNYPNPFNPSTQIDFDVPVQSHVRIVVYNLVGQLVGTIVDRTFNPGGHQIEWSPELNSGVYFARIEADPLDGSTNGFRKTVKMVLLK